MADNKRPVAISLQLPADIAEEFLNALEARIKHHKTHLKLYGGIGKAAKKNEPRETLILELEKAKTELQKQI